MKIYEYIITHELEFPYMSIRELADGVSTSTASILRFCKKLGYEKDTFEAALLSSIPQKTVEVNKKAVELGYAAVCSGRGRE